VDALLDEVKEKFAGIVPQREMIPLSQDQLPACAY
jgi:hypothetical protein